MSGVKGFSIVTIIFLCVAFFFLAIGHSEESLEDKQFKEEYEKTMIGEMDMPIMIISRVDFTNGNKPLYEELKSSYIMSDLHKKHFNLYFCYSEMTDDVLKIKEIIVNDGEHSLEFVQSSDAMENKDDSFVVFGLNPEITKNHKNIVIDVIFSENKLNFRRREFIIYPQYIDLAYEGIEEYYKKFYESLKEI